MGKIIDAIFIFLGCIWYIIIWGLGLKFLFYFHKYISDNSFLNFIFYIVVIFCIYKILKQIKEIYYIKNILEKMKIQKIKILFQKMIIMNGMKIEKGKEKKKIKRKN